MIIFLMMLVTTYPKNKAIKSKIDIRKEVRNTLTIPEFNINESFDTIGQRKPIKGSKQLFVTKIFSISFNYLQRACRTKALKITYSNGYFIYKVVLESNISIGSRLCWLQYLHGQWSVILGTDIDENLLIAITSAIEADIVNQYVV
jgi:hypothetical protein